MMPIHDFLNLLIPGLAIVAAGLLLLPVGTCKECPHCKAATAERKDKAMRQEHLLIGHLCRPACPLYNPRAKR